MTDYPEAARPLAELEPEHEFFVGIDSDGCAFDTMEVKHKECFTPNIIKHWNLQPVSKYAREAAEFVNLYSKWRGINRWPALVMVFDLLREREEVQARHVIPPEAPRIRVNAIAPGFFLTEQNRFLLTDEATGELTQRGRAIIDHTPMARFGDPDDLLGTVLWLLSPASSFVTGIVVPIDGGFSAFSGV